MVARRYPTRVNEVNDNYSYALILIEHNFSIYILNNLQLVPKYLSVIKQQYEITFAMLAYIASLFV